MLEGIHEAMDELGISINTSVADMTLQLVVSDMYYDLQGRQVTNPTHGIYIHNGRKVLLK